MTTQRRGGETPDKTDLTPRERLKVTYFYEVRGIPQHILAEIFEVNPGRVNEAISKIKVAMEDES